MFANPTQHFPCLLLRLSTVVLLLCVKDVVNSVVICAAAICWQVEEFVRLGEISSANKAAALDHRRLELQFFRAALPRDMLEALVVVRFIQGIASCLSVVREDYKAVGKV